MSWCPWVTVRVCNGKLQELVYLVWPCRFEDLVAKLKVCRPANSGGGGFPEFRTPNLHRYFFMDAYIPPHLVHRYLGIEWIRSHVPLEFPPSVSSLIFAYANDHLLESPLLAMVVHERVPRVYYERVFLKTLGGKYLGRPFESIAHHLKRGPANDHSLQSIAKRDDIPGFSQPQMFCDQCSRMVCAQNEKFYECTCHDRNPTFCSQCVRRFLNDSRKETSSFPATLEAALITDQKLFFREFQKKHAVVPYVSQWTRRPETLMVY